jgi:hypothetical protein
MTISNEANGEAVLHGPLLDQAALHGVLIKIRDLGLPLEEEVLTARGVAGWCLSSSIQAMKLGQKWLLTGGKRRAATQCAGR